MLRNYFKIAFRNLVKNKFSSIINIGGLVLGMAVALLIGLWVYDELSFNTYHKNYDSIGKIMVHNGTDIDATYSYQQLPLAKELHSAYGRDFKHIVVSTGTGDHILATGDKKFTQTGVYLGSEAPDMFSLKMTAGSSKGLIDPHSILLNQTLSKKLYGDANPINKVIRLDNLADLKVTGVYEDIPKNSSFSDASFITPFDLLLSTSDYVKTDQNNWEDHSFLIYVQLADGVSFDGASKSIEKIQNRFLDKKHLAYDPQLFVHPMSKWHLFSHFEYKHIATSEELKFVWFYISIGIFVLLLACINFMNLSTARSEKRAKEVGIRKVVGSERGLLIRQFFCESLLTVFIAFLASLAGTALLLPWFNRIVDKDIHIPWLNPVFWIAGMTFVLITGLLAGSYPAFYLSSFKPVKVLKGTFQAGRFASIPRKVLVVFQFCVSIMLIIGTLIVYRQIQFAKNRPVGYSRENLIQIQMTTDDYKDKYEVLRTQLKNTGVVEEMAESSGPVTGSYSNTGGVVWKGKDPKFEDDFARVRISYDYARTLGLKFIDGRDFSKNLATDSTGLIINETAAKYMGMSHAAGQIVRWDNTYENVKGNYKIIGVVKDLVMNSPFDAVKQTIFKLGDNFGFIMVRLRPEANIHDAISKIATVFKTLIPSAPFDYKFVDEQYASKFKAEERVGTLALFFSALAILISCLGLFGLASFVAEQRTREIGVRKVLGATVLQVWSILSADFVRLVLIAMVIATPLTYLFMNKWLSNYQYRIEIPWWIFLFSGLGALVVTLLTVSFQAIKAALVNPVRSLRSE